jgi:hypothetical protein
VKHRRFRVRNLLLSWTAYWLALVVVGLSPAIIAIQRLASLGPGRGNVNAGVSDTGMYATVIQDGVTTYNGSISLLTVALLVALPPLVMWAVFVLATPRTNDADENDVVRQAHVPSLNAGDTEFFSRSSPTSKRTSREGS